MLQDFSSVKPNVFVHPLYSSALWSLHYEWWFYMLYFPLVTLVRREKQTVLVGAIGILAAITYLYYPNPVNRLLFYFPIWWTGVLGARAFIERGRVSRRSLRLPSFFLAIIASFLSLDCLDYLVRGKPIGLGLHPFLEFRHVVAALVVVHLGLSWQRFGWFGFSNIFGWGSPVAPISYSLYVAHIPLFVRARYLQGYFPPVVEKVLYAVALIGFCCGMELWLYPKLKNLSRASKVPRDPATRPSSNEPRVSRS